MDIYKTLKKALENEVERRHLSGEKIRVRCGALSASEAIGNPEETDYPIIKGKEIMVEAVFKGARGQAFTDEFENADYLIDDLLTMDVTSNKNRAAFISALNAIYRYLDLCDKTIHCKNEEPKECANHLSEALGAANNILLVGHQPRFLEILASTRNVRVVDMDQDNIGTARLNVLIEPPEATLDAINWCDAIFATGSTIVNGTLTDFLDQGKPALFYGVTISAAAHILNLKKFCHCGH